ncbi:MAG TPA: glycosyltransferase family 39 protein [Chloroflexia bacterium]|nr:glycosyltransferase family 39 protein [Chloroflexia bacterium]
MQTRPRPPENERLEDQQVTTTAQDSPLNTEKARLKKGLNVALAFLALGLAFLYISKDWSLYTHVPGGRKVLLGLDGVALVGLAAWRVWLSTGQSGLRRVAVRAWQDARVREAVPVGLILILALWVRLWGVNFGLPYLEQVDEWNVAERALHIAQTSNFDPYDYRHPGLADNDRQAFTYPTFYTYLETGVFSARFLQGVSAGKYDGTSAMAAPENKADFYLWGRGLTAILGAATALLVYLVARRVYGKPVGLVAALFLSFFYLHALNSHWLTTDVPSGFMAMLPFLWIVPIMEGRSERRLYLLAGLAAGLAVATKYNNALILLPLVVAHLLSRPPRQWLNWNLPLAFLAAFAGFFAGAPFIFFHIPAFLTDLAAIVNHYQNVGHPGFEANDNWLEYIRFMLADNAVIVWLGLGGLLLMAARHSRKDLVLLSFPLLTYLQLSSYKVNFSRNLMPVIPFLVIFAALFLVVAVRWLFSLPALRPYESLPGRLRLSSANLAIGLVALLAIIGPAQTILSYDSYNARPTNRALATDWIEQNLPHGAKLWLEPFSTDLLPRNEFRLEGGKGILTYPPEWYAANGFHYVVLSEAYYKEAYESGNPVVRANYHSFVDGPYPPGFSLVKAFRKDETHPGADIIILKTGLPLLTTAGEAAKNSQPLSLDFGGSIRLIGIQGAADLKAGQTANITLYWQTLKKPDADYTTFLHLQNAQGQTVAQLDLAPFAGTRPTSGWQPGEVLRDEYPLTLPASLPPGSYKLTAGLYIAPNGGRLALPGGQTEATLGTFEVKGAK